jgi:hypothetical protein
MEIAQLIALPDFGYAEEVSELVPRPDFVSQRTQKTNLPVQIVYPILHPCFHQALQESTSILYPVL